MKTYRKSISIFLALLMILLAMPLASIAVDAAEIDPPSSEQVVTEASDKIQAEPETDETDDILNIDVPSIEELLPSGRSKVRRRAEGDSSIDFSWNESTKTLTFSGVGAMTDYEMGQNEAELLPEMPWSEYYDKAEKVVIGEGITHVGSMSFAGFTALETVIFPSTLTSIGEGAFMYDINLATADLPAGLTEIGESAFGGNRLTNVVIPAGVRTLSSCFSYNLAKMNLTLPEGIETIQDSFNEAFIDNLVIPASVQSFSSDGIYNVKTFVNNSATASVIDCLKSADDSDAACNFRFMMYGVEFSTSLNYLRTGEEPQDESFLLPVYNEFFGTNFETFDELLDAYDNGELDETLVDMMENSMNGFNVPLSYIKIYCLSESEEHDAIRTKGYPHYLIDQDNALCNDDFEPKCGDNMTWSIDDGVLVIHGFGEMYDEYSGWAFYRDDFSSVKFVNEGGQITTIGAAAFANFGDLESIELPASTMKVGWSWISYCNIDNLIIPAGFEYSNLEYIYYLFYDADIDTITVEANNEAYYTYEGGLYTKDDATLAYYFGSGDAVIKAGTEKINSYAFYRNEELTSVTIPASVVLIGGSWPFDNCPKLKRVILEERTQELQLSAYVFYNCNSLEEFVVSENDLVFSAVNGVLYSKDMTKVLAVPAAVTDLVLPERVTGVGDQSSGANYYRAGLENLTVENPDFDFGQYSTDSACTSAFDMSDDKSKVTVTGHTGSTAEDFAMQHGFKFVSLEGITVDSVVFDLSNVPSTVTIGENYTRFSSWDITGVVTYSDGTTRTLKFTEYSGRDFGIDYKRPGNTGWSEGYSSIDFDYLGDYVFRIIYGEYTEEFTITCQNVNYHYEFDTSEAVTQVKQYSSYGSYRVGRYVPVDEYSSEYVCESILGVKLYKVYDDGETERELANIESYTSIRYGDDNYWSNLVNEETGTYTVSFGYSRGDLETSASIDVEVIPGDYSLVVDYSNALTSVVQFGEYTRDNWGLSVKLVFTDGTEYDLTEYVSFYADNYNSLNTSFTGEYVINPYLSVYRDYSDTQTSYFVEIHKSLDPITVTVVPDETVAAVRLEVPEIVEIEKNYYYDLRTFVTGYIDYTDGTTEEITDKNDFRFNGVQNGGSMSGYSISLSRYGETWNYTVSYAGESAQFKVKCKQLYTYKVVADEDIEITKADRDVTASDLGLIVGWFNPEGIMADITDEVVLEGNTSLGTIGRHIVNVTFYENKEIDLGWRTIGTVTFNVVCDTHSLERFDAVPGADCKTAGTIEYWKCSECGRMFADENGETAITSIEGGPFGAHSPADAVMENDVPSTCKVLGGYDMVTHCSICNDILDSEHFDYTEYADHVFGQWTTVTPATCKDEGSAERVCTVCGEAKETKTLDVDASNHTGGTEIRDAKAATCESKGYTGDTYCLGCNAKIGGGKSIDALGHNYVEVSRTAPTCKDDGVAVYVCANDGTHTKTESIPKVGHKDDDHDGMCDFDCGTEMGSSSSQNICKWCGKDHSGNFWQKIVAFFHRIFAGLFGSKY